MTRNEFPAAPDWIWLNANFPAGAGLRMGASMADVIRFCRGHLVYLATPYSMLVTDDDGKWDAIASLTVEIRTARWVRRLALDGITAISPILMACEICHADAEGDPDPLDDAFWAAWCQPLLSRSGVVVIPPMAGWEASRGVWREACWALRNNQPVFVIEEGAGL